MRWEKVLYKKQAYPDNYSGGKRQFLKELRKNVSVVQYSYSEAVIGSSNLVFHMDCVILFYVLFEYVSSDAIDDHFLLYTFFMGFGMMYLICSLMMDLRSRLEDHRYTLLTLVSFGAALTPIIRTLTDTISTDTIYAMSFLTATVSCIFHDYGVKAPIVSLPLSLSSGLCSAVFMVSRLQTNLLAFSMLAIAFALHACSPHGRNAAFSQFPCASTCISGILSIFTVAMVSTISYELAVTVLVMESFLLFVCPFLLTRLQRHKRTIHGPWDEAVPCTNNNKID